MPPSIRVGCDLGDGLTQCQSHSHRLQGEKVVVLQLRGAWVVVFSRGYEGDPGECAMLYHLHASRGWERGKDKSDIRGAGVWGCVSKGSTRVASEERSWVLHRSGTMSRSCVDSSLSHGFGRVGGVKETDRGVAWEAVYSA